MQGVTVNLVTREQGESSGRLSPDLGVLFALGDPHRWVENGARTDLDGWLVIEEDDHEPVEQDCNLVVLDRVRPQHGAGGQLILLVAGGYQDGVGEGPLGLLLDLSGRNGFVDTRPGTPLFLGPIQLVLVANQGGLVGQLPR